MCKLINKLLLCVFSIQCELPLDAVDRITLSKYQKRVILQASMEEITQNNSEVNISQTTEKNAYHTETNLYPTIRTVLLSLCVILTISLVLFLIYQNGKSLYANGI